MCLFAGSLWSLLVFTGPASNYNLPISFSRIHEARLKLPIIHFCMMILNYITSNTRFTYNSIKQLAGFVGMILTIYLICIVSRLAYIFPRPMIWINTNLGGMFCWLEIEWLVFGGTLIANILFLAIRCLVTHKIQFDQLPERKQLPNVDTIFAIIDVSNAFTGQVVPLFVGFWLNRLYVIHSKAFNWALVVILFSNIISVFCITVMVFVSYKTGPEWWLKISLKVFKILVWVNYIVVPFSNLVALVVLVAIRKKEIFDDIASSWVVFWAVLCVFRIIEFFTTIRHSIIRDASNY